jgi:hypothetical protein
VLGSLRTLPLELAAILEKEDLADCLVVKAGLTYKSLDELPDGTVVGTSSVRRTAQLKRSFPKLNAMVVVSLMLINKTNLVIFFLFDSGETCAALTHLILHRLF